MSQPVGYSTYRCCHYIDSTEHNTNSININCIRVKTNIRALLNILPIFTLHQGKHSYQLVLGGNKVKVLPTILPGNYLVITG